MTQTNRDICSLANKTQKIISNIQTAPGECTKSYQIDVVSKTNVIQSKDVEVPRRASWVSMLLNEGAKLWISFKLCFKINFGPTWLV